MLKSLHGAASAALVGAAVGALALVTISVSSQRAEANAAFAQQTGKSCKTCHTAPPALNATGKRFKAKGNKL